jgi:hypothetical protein
METFTPSELKLKSAFELFSMRKRVVAELQSNADGYEGREQTANEKALEERASCAIGDKTCLIGCGNGPRNHRGSTRRAYDLAWALSAIGALTSWLG